MAVVNKKNNHKYDFVKPGAVTLRGCVIMRASDVFNINKKKQKRNRAKWIGKKVRSKAGTEYTIIGFDYQPGIFNFAGMYQQRTPLPGVWMQRTDGTYQMRFLTVAQYNDLMVLDKKVGK